MILLPHACDPVPLRDRYRQSVVLHIQYFIDHESYKGRWPKRVLVYMFEMDCYGVRNK